MAVCRRLTSSSPVVRLLDCVGNVRCDDAVVIVLAVSKQLTLASTPSLCTFELSLPI